MVGSSDDRLAWEKLRADNRIDSGTVGSEFIVEVVTVSSVVNNPDMLIMRYYDKLKVRVPVERKRSPEADENRRCFASCLLLVFQHYF
jgi:hypothetical protein